MVSRQAAPSEFAPVAGCSLATMSSFLSICEELPEKQAWTLDERPPERAPWTVARRPVGRIAIANSEALANAMTEGAIGGSTEQSRLTRTDRLSNANRGHES